MAEITANEPAETAVLSDQPQSRSALTFVVGLAVAAGVALGHEAAFGAAAVFSTPS